MKKSISIVLALVMMSAFFIPVYAEEVEIPDETLPAETTVVTTTTTTAVATLPESPAETTSNSYGVIETPLPTPPSGNGTVLEDVDCNQVSRQFITVQSKGGHVFYIIIENDGRNENVYFLNAVDDFDLLSFSENFPEGVLEAYDELKDEAARAEAERVIEANQGEGSNSESTKTTPNATEEENTGGSKNYIVIGIGVCFLGGLIYFKFIKGKGKGKSAKQQNFDEEDDIYEDNYEENSETEQEDK